MDDRDPTNDSMDDALPPALRELVRDYNAPPTVPREAMWERIRAGRRDGGTDGESFEPGILPLAERPSRRSASPPPRRRPPVWIPWSAGIAALLALGVGIGRVWEREAAGGARAGADSSRAPVAAAVPSTTTDSATAPALEPPAAPGERGGNGQLTVAARAPRAGREPSPAVPPSRRPAPEDALNPAYRLTLTQHLSQSEAFLTLFRASVRSGRTERLAGATAEQLLATNRLLLDSPAGADRRTRHLLEDLELVLAQIAQLNGDTQAADRSTEARMITEDLDQSDMLPRIRTAVPAGGQLTFSQGEL
ncbi:MAG TPA: hypothetical protein VFS40_16545 [Gemmatimonadales bacterium]|nr:hypothetical protein [Gemmatimonadales bacterium]